MVMSRGLRRREELVFFWKARIVVNRLMCASTGVTLDGNKDSGLFCSGPQRFGGEEGRTSFDWRNVGAGGRWPFPTRSAFLVHRPAAHGIRQGIRPLVRELPTRSASLVHRPAANGIRQGIRPLVRELPTRSASLVHRPAANGIRQGIRPLVRELPTRSTSLVHTTPRTNQIKIRIMYG